MCRYCWFAVCCSLAVLLPRCYQPKALVALTRSTSTIMHCIPIISKAGSSSRLHLIEVCSVLRQGNTEYSHHECDTVLTSEIEIRCGGSLTIAFSSWRSTNSQSKRGIRNSERQDSAGARWCTASSDWIHIMFHRPWQMKCLPFPGPKKKVSFNYLCQ